MHLHLSPSWHMGSCGRSTSLGIRADGVLPCSCSALTTRCQALLQVFVDKLTTHGSLHADLCPPGPRRKTRCQTNRTSTRHAVFKLIDPSSRDVAMVSCAEPHTRNGLRITSQRLAQATQTNVASSLTQHCNVSVSGDHHPRLRLHARL